MRGREGLRRAHPGNPGPKDLGWHRGICPRAELKGQVTRVGGGWGHASEENLDFLSAPLRTQRGRCPPQFPGSGLACQMESASSQWLSVPGSQGPRGSNVTVSPGCQQEIQLIDLKNAFKSLLMEVMGLLSVYIVWQQSWNIFM